MSRLSELEREIQNATEAVARAERTAAMHPDYPSAFVTLRSAEKYRENLIEQFDKEISLYKLNACSYRIEYDEIFGPSIHGITSAVGLFQDIFTNIYHALKNGVKKRMKISSDSLEATRLEFAYTFSGSVGFMMTLKNEVSLF